VLSRQLKLLSYAMANRFVPAVLRALILPELLQIQVKLIQPDMEAAQSLTDLREFDPFIQTMFRRTVYRFDLPLNTVNFSFARSSLMDEDVQIVSEAIAKKASNPDQQTSRNLAEHS
jgi:hypothetical protein